MAAAVGGFALAGRAGGVFGSTAELDRLGLKMPNTHSGMTVGPDAEAEQQLAGFQIMGIEYASLGSSTTTRWNSFLASAPASFPTPLGHQAAAGGPTCAAAQAARVSAGGGGWRPAPGMCSARSSPSMRPRRR